MEKLKKINTEEIEIKRIRNKEKKLEFEVYYIPQHNSTGLHMFSVIEESEHNFKLSIKINRSNIGHTLVFDTMYSVLRSFEFVKSIRYLLTNKRVRKYSYKLDEEIEDVFTEFQNELLYGGIKI